MKNHWQSGHSIALLLIFIGTGIAIALTPSNILFLWLAMAVAMTAFAIVAGYGITGRFWLGWLVNEQYRMSLSRLQMFLWTLLVLSAFVAAVILNIRRGYVENALEISLPQELWIVMGIGTTSLVASPLILAQKKKEPTNVDEAMRTLGRTGMMGADAVDEHDIEEHFIGQVQRNLEPGDASVGDLMRGEQTSTADVLDLARLQNLFFTLVLAGTYGLNVGNYFIAQAAGEGMIAEFPALNSAFTALLAISTAGYLAAKSVDNQPPGGDPIA